MLRNCTRACRTVTCFSASLVVETTDSTLAEQLGRTLHHAHRGNLKIDWGGEQLCRVDW